MDKIRLRNAEKKYCDILFTMICDLENYSFDKKKFKSLCSVNLSNPNIHYIIAEIDGKVIGFAGLHIQKIFHHCGKVAEVQEIYIDPSFRNKKIGNLLLQHLKKIANKNRCKMFEVASNINRTNAHRFYEQVGLIKTHYKFTDVL